MLAASMKLSSSGSGVHRAPDCCTAHSLPKAPVRSSQGGFALSADRAAWEACCIRISTCLCVSRSIHSLTTHHKAADQKGPSTLFFNSLCLRESQHPRGMGSGWHLIASELCKRPAQPARQRGAGEAGTKVSGKAYRVTTGQWQMGAGGRGPGRFGSRSLCFCRLARLTILHVMGTKTDFIWCRKRKTFNCYLRINCVWHVNIASVKSFQNHSSKLVCLFLSYASTSCFFPIG